MKNNKTENITFRISNTDKENIKNLALESGLTLSKFIRSEVIEKDLTILPRKEKNKLTTIAIRVSEKEKQYMESLSDSHNISMSEIIIETILAK
jgi:uncharacterized protein (DUF1778 family)